MPHRRPAQRAEGGLVPPVRLVRRITVKVLNPTKGKDKTYRFCAKVGHHYLPETVDNILAYCVDEVDKHFAGYQFKLVALPDNHWNIVPLTMDELCAADFLEAQSNNQGEQNMKQVRVSVLGHSVTFTVAVGTEVNKLDSTAVQVGDTHIRFNSPIQVVEDITPAAEQEPTTGPEVVQGTSTSTTAPDATAPAPEVVHGVSTHADEPAKVVEITEKDVAATTEPSTKAAAATTDAQE